MSFSLTSDRLTQGCHGAGERPSPDPGDSRGEFDPPGAGWPRRAGTPTTAAGRTADGIAGTHSCHWPAGTGAVQRTEMATSAW